MTTPLVFKLHKRHDTKISYHTVRHPLNYTLCTAHGNKQIAAVSSSLYLNCHTHTHSRLMALCPGLPRWVGTRKVKSSGFYWSKRQWVAVESAGPYARLHLAPDRYPCQHHTAQFLQSGCPSCRPTNSIKALKAKLYLNCQSIANSLGQSYPCWKIEEIS